MAKPVDLDDARALCFNQRAGKLVGKFPTCYWGLQCVGPLYKAAQNDVFWSIREANCKHFFNLFEQSSSSKEFWKHLKSAVVQNNQVWSLTYKSWYRWHHQQAICNGKCLMNSLLLWPLPTGKGLTLMQFQHQTLRSWKHWLIAKLSAKTSLKYQISCRNLF